MSLNDLFTINIATSTVLPTKAGFGTPLVAGYHTKYSDRVRYYSNLAGLTSDGFTPADAIYRAMAIAFSQSPSSAKVGLGRCGLPPTQVLTLTCLSSTTGDVYAFTVVGTDGIAHPISYQVPTSSTTTSVATAIAALLTAVATLGTVAHTAAVITLTQAAGVLNDIQGWDVTKLTIADTTTDPGIATDLAAIQAADGTGWYGLGLASNSAAEILAAAAFAEANNKIFSCNNSDTAIALGTTGNVALQTKTNNYARTHGLYSGSAILSYSGIGLMSQRLTDVAGSDTWAYKIINGVPTDNLTETQTNNIANANWNYYVSFKGQPNTIEGKTPAGAFIDIVRGRDALADEIQTNLLAAVSAQSKIGYTDAGRDYLINVVLATLLKYTKAPINFLDPGNGADIPAPSVSAPTVAQQSPSDRAARRFPGVTFNAKLAGAIQGMTINGFATV